MAPYPAQPAWPGGRRNLGSLDLVPGAISAAFDLDLDPVVAGLKRPARRTIRPDDLAPHSLARLEQADSVRRRRIAGVRQENDQE
jgi:hypothetical protein